VTCWERDVDDRRLVAFVTEDATARLGLAERLLETVRAELPSQFIPAHVFRVDRLPRTAAGKLQRRGLAGTYLDEVIAHGQGEGPGIGTVVDLRHRASVVIRRGS
jgi:acyl-coenzyme A synthetase/AMP-(fatty) acid ligase